MSSGPNPGKAVGTALTEVPMGAMIFGIAEGIVKAQEALDMAMLRSALMMTGEVEDANGNKTKTLLKFDGEEVSLMELGFTPTFYQFADTTIEVKISLSMTEEEDSSKTNFDLRARVDGKVSPGFFSLNASVTASVSSVSATFSSKYNYSAEGSSSVRTRLVTVPAPPLLEQRLRRSLDKKVANRT